MLGSCQECARERAPSDHFDQVEVDVRVRLRERSLTDASTLTKCQLACALASSDDHLIETRKSVKSRLMRRGPVQICITAGLVVLAAILIGTGVVRAQPEKGEATGLPLPRFVSLKSDRVNMRSGPGVEYPTLWVYRRVGLPLEVIKEFEGWRQVRDSEGATGWVMQSLLSGRRTAQVMPWEIKANQTPPLVALRSDDRESSAPIAEIEAGVIANITSCDGRWCNIAIGDVRGYVQQNKLWGVYSNETVR
jgi:SH3-like domain-containing protein